jgi:signal transduction histidine kinase
MTPLRTSHVYYYAAVVTLSVAVAAIVGYGSIRREMLAANDFFLDVESKEMLSRLVSLPPGAKADGVDRALREHAEDDSAVFYFNVHSSDGKELFRSHNLKDRQLPVLAAGETKRTFDLDSFGLMRVAQFKTSAGPMEIAISLRNFRHVNESFFLVMLAGLPVIALFSILVGMRLRRSTLEPVRTIKATASHINASNLNERIPVPRGDSEMAGLARLLNQMFDRLENSFKQIKRFTADTSHELMTPLAVIRLHAERMRNEAELPERIRQSLDEQLQEVAHLCETLEKLMVLTKADSSVLPLDLKSSSTSEFVSNFAEDAQLLVEDKERQFAVVRNDTAEATFDHGWIRQVLLNLLSNALHFSPPHGVITLHSQCEDRQWTVEIWDEGAGVPFNRLGELFQRFSQINGSPKPRSGSGLGLAICKSIVELHHGTITARNRADRSGFVVSFSLPLNSNLKDQS